MSTSITLRRVEKVCENCGKVFYAQTRKAKYCIGTNCQRQAYMKKNQEQRAEYQRNWFIEHRDEKREGEKRRLKQLRLEVLAHYGGKCAFCGDTNVNHLSMDHVNNDGNKHRESFRNTRQIYEWLRRHKYPDGFQVLCHTHNLEKGFYKTMTMAEFDDGGDWLDQINKNNKCDHVRTDFNYICPKCFRYVKADNV